MGQLQTGIDMVKETVVTKAGGLAGDAAALGKDKLKTLFVRGRARSSERES